MNVPAVGAGRRRGAITRKHRAIFLERLAAGFSVAAAAAPTGRGRQRYYELRDADAEFGDAWRDAWEAGQDVIEDELLRAATEGWMEVDEVYEGGELVRRIERQRKNPALLAKLERKRQPETSPLVEVNVRPTIEAKPVGFPDILDFLRETGQMHHLRSMHPAMTRRVLPLLTPAELAKFADTIDAEALEPEPAGEEEATETSVTPVSVPRPQVRGARREARTSPAETRSARVDRLGHRLIDGCRDGGELVACLVVRHGRIVGGASALVKGDNT